MKTYTLNIIGNRFSMSETYTHANLAELSFCAIRRLLAVMDYLPDGAEVMADIRLTKELEAKGYWANIVWGATATNKGIERDI